jgi:hypothetical protein
MWLTIAAVANSVSRLCKERAGRRICAILNRAVFGPWSPLDDTIKALQPRTAIFESLPGSGISAAE